MHGDCPLCHKQHDAGAHDCPTQVMEVVSRDVESVADPLIGQLLADRYRIQRSLGEGGMGRVYLAEHERMGRLSAVKVMSPALASTAEAISRFNREAANASRINQPNVAAIYDFGETADGVLYLAMEYVEGETLTSLIRREGPLAAPRAAELAGQVAEGLHAAHHLGIVHRDLKPDNILVTRHHDGREWVKIVDFGIAKQTKQNDQTVTSLGIAVGTPDYMSPEQIAGEPLDARTDLYSLGLVLFNMLTGQLPHRAMTSKQSLVQRLTVRPRTLAEVAPDKPWSPRLQKALDRALAPEIDDRYTTVLDFASDVRGAVGMPTFVGGAVATPAMLPHRAAEPALRTPVRGTPTPAPRRHGLLISFVILLVMGGAAATMPRARVLRVMADLTSPRTRPQVVAPAPLPDSAFSAATLPTSTTPDSAATVTQSGALSPTAPGQQLERAALLAGRRASGDSSEAGAPPAVMQSAEDDAREVMVHVNRARELTRTDRLQGAGLELRTAYEEYRIFLTEHSTAPQLEALRRDLQDAMDGALSACNVAREADVAGGGKGFRCEHPAKTGILMVYDAAPPTARPTP